jgi:hypothetical protein
MDESLIIETWDVFKEYIAEKNRDIAATHYVDFLIGKDVETSTLESVMGYDSHLDDAIQLVLGDEQSDDDVDEDDWDSHEEDEDY